MARPASVMKQGFYPAPAEAIAGILRHLKRPPPGPGHVRVLDPCAGEGAALHQLGEGLGAALYAIELNTLRADRIRQAYPEVNLLGPCSYAGTRFTYHSWGLVYCNPPFDDEFGGGQREEEAFVRRAVDAVAFNGILVLVCPLAQVYGKRRMCETLDMYFRDIEVFLFPDSCRRFGECVVIGKRRRSFLAPSEFSKDGTLFKRTVSKGSYDLPWDTLPRLGEPGYDVYDWGGKPNPLSRREVVSTWEVPLTEAPRTFEKVALTQEEVIHAVEHSPLYARLRGRELRPIGRPPLSLNKGHTSLVLLTGLLDGYVPSEPPHVVRGYCAKVERLARRESHDTPGGTHVEKEVYAEVPNPIVRAVWADGTIRTFSEKPQAQEEQKPSGIVLIEDNVLDDD